MSSVLAVVGGSGMYEMPGLCDLSTVSVDTPYGCPSAPIVRGHLGDTQLLFLPRHGHGHHIAPHRINYRANVCALKMLGATHLVSLSAVGSMREAIRPGDVVVANQLIDMTRQRPSTFFDQGIVAHVSMADPVCPHLSAAAIRAGERAKAPRVHTRGTYICIEGPQFSSRAESELYRSWGVDVIGMTAMPEAKLAREAELPYSLVAFSTDYDCWHQADAPVTVEMVLAVSRKNVELAQRIVAELTTTLPERSECTASRALDGAIMTSPSAQSTEAREQVAWLLGARS
jgi:5'-methylthioadenosine phosphorylase